MRNVGFILMTVRETGRELQHLLKIVVNRKMLRYCRLQATSRNGRKLLAMMSIIFLQKNNLRKRNFEVQVLKKFRSVITFKRKT